MQKYIKHIMQTNMMRGEEIFTSSSPKWQSTAMPCLA